VKRKVFRANGMKIRMRGKDDLPLSMSDLGQGLFELMRRLQPYHAYRIKTATMYLTVVDERGDEVTLAKTGEWSIFPYECAADRSDPR
jgi:hypothetical protein